MTYATVLKPWACRLMWNVRRNEWEAEPGMQTENRQISCNFCDKKYEKVRGVLNVVKHVHGTTIATILLWSLQGKTAIESPHRSNPDIKSTTFCPIHPVTLNVLHNF